MRNKKRSVDYGMFSNPYTGLGVMIFMQADNDLRELGGKDHRVYSWGVMYKSEIIQFLKSKWAMVLASEIGIEQSKLDEYVRLYA